jgi:hypothetical protein
MKWKMFYRIWRQYMISAGSTPTPKRNKQKFKRIAWGILLVAIFLTGCSNPNVDPDYMDDPTGFFPHLDDPPEARRLGGGGGGNPDIRGMIFELVTELSIEEVYQYYAQQLEDEGWVNFSTDFESDLYTSYWERYTERGQVWPAVLEVSTQTVNPEADYAVELRAVLPP